MALMGERVDNNLNWGFHSPVKESTYPLNTTTKYTADKLGPQMNEMTVWFYSVWLMDALYTFS